MQYPWRTDLERQTVTKTWGGIKRMQRILLSEQWARYNDRYNEGGRDLHRKGATPRVEGCARFGWKSFHGRSVVQSHWLARKRAENRGAPCSPFSSSSSSSFPPFSRSPLFPSVLIPSSNPSTTPLSLSLSRTLHILPLPYQVLLRFFFPPLLSFIKYSCAYAYTLLETQDTLDRFYDYYAILLRYFIGFCLICVCDCECIRNLGIEIGKKLNKFHFIKSACT